jgi:GT2 family glycosyltransferase
MPLPTRAPQSPHLCVLITSFNRKGLTLQCIARLKDIRDTDKFQISVVLVDDGSTDGTGEQVRNEHPWVRLIINTDAPLYWCRGMHRAFAEALSIGYDHYVFLNDDTVLFPDSIERLLNCEQQLRASKNTPCIVVGSTQDAVSGERTYGGEIIASPYRPIKLTGVKPTSSPQALDTFNGNIVLIPAEVVSRIGNLDPAYEHAFGDIDYGLRARKAGIGVWLAPGFHGTCQLNPVAGSYRDVNLPIWERWRLLTGRKNLPIKSWVRFTRRHAGILWPAYLLHPYLKFLISLGRW